MTYPLDTRLYIERKGCIEKSKDIGVLYDDFHDKTTTTAKAAQSNVNYILFPLASLLTSYIHNVPLLPCNSLQLK